MKFTILGAGNTGKAYSAYLTSLGHQVILYDRVHGTLSLSRTMEFKPLER